MAGPLDAAEFLTGFLAEAEDHLRSARKNLGSVLAATQTGGNDPRAVRELFRSLHTIKGLAGMVGIEPIVDLAHAMETVFRAADRAGAKLPLEVVDRLEQGLAAVETRVACVAAGRVVPIAPHALIELLLSAELDQPEIVRSGVIVGLEPALAAKLSVTDTQQLLSAGASGRRAVRVDFVPSRERAAAGISITTVRAAISAIADIVKVVPLSRAPDADSPGGLMFALLVVTGASDQAIAKAAATRPEHVISIAGPPPPQPGGEEAALEAPQTGVVRVDVARLDDALERLSALVVNRFRLDRALGELAASGVDLRRVHEILRENRRQLRDLRASIMRARMVPVAEMLERVPLLVRGLSRSTGKPVRVEIEAGQAELDKAVAERLFPAIIHLIRNAVDHALEPPEERLRRGKPAEGLIRVVCAPHSSTQLELCVSDDGRGVDADAVARRADVPVPDSEAGLLALLTMPGLSTMEHATHTSGRGMGMNIVRQIAVDQLGGDLTMRSTPGAGTAFILRVPLSITIIDAFAFEAGAQRFATPVAAIDEIVDMSGELTVTAPGNGGAHAARMLSRRGQTVPLLALDHVFGLTPIAGANRKALLIRRNGEPFAFEVDRMLGQQEVVVRPLEDPLVKVVGVTGSTDLGDGRPTLVLDLPALSQWASSGSRSARA